MARYLVAVTAPVYASDDSQGDRWRIVEALSILEAGEMGQQGDDVLVYVVPCPEVKSLD